MSVKEVLYFRIPQFIQKKILGHYQKGRKPKLLIVNPNFKPSFYKKEDLNKLFIQFPISTLFDVFNYTIEIFSIDNWRTDFLNIIESPINYYGSIERQNFEINGDIKFVSELSRFEFLPFLALKCIEDEDFQKKYLKRLEQIICDWNTQNPYLQSIHWTSGIEIGIRSVNLIYTHIVLNQFNLLSDELDFQIRKQISYNYMYLKRHLSLYSSANNHLMAELMGLNVISSYFSVSTMEANRWRRLFFLEIQKQVNDDGVHMELCTRYHVEVTDQILIGLTFIQDAGNNVPSQVWQKFQKMFQFTQHVDYLGNETIFGDNDEGSVIKPYFDLSFSIYRSQMQTSNYMFGTSYNSPGQIDFRNYLIFGSAFRSHEKCLPQKDTLFKDSGYCFIYDHSNKSKLSFDCGPIGDDISAAHGHSDIFHFNVEVNGLPFIIDPGTYQYHSKAIFWRNYFRGITAHNTLSVNGRDHATNNGRMSWLNCPDVYVNYFNSKKNMTTCMATTNAFLREGIEKHTRTITYDKINKLVKIEDLLAGKDSKKKKVDFYLHFHPETKIKQGKNELILNRMNTKVIISNEHFNLSEIHFGNEDIPLGWFSKEYNLKQQSNTLKLELSFKNKIKLETYIRY